MPLDTKPYTIEVTYQVRRTFNVEATDEAHAESLIKRDIDYVEYATSKWEVNKQVDIAQDEAGETYLSYKQQRLQEQFDRKGQLQENQYKYVSDLYVGLLGKKLVHTTVRIPKYNVGWSEAHKLNALTSPVDVSHLLDEENKEGRHLVYFLKNKKGTYTMIRVTRRDRDWANNSDTIHYGVITNLSAHCVKRAYACKKEEDFSYSHFYFLKEFTKEEIEYLGYKFTEPSPEQIQNHREQLEESLFS